MMEREDIIKIIDGEVYYHYDYTDYLYNIINKAIEYIKNVSNNGMFELRMEEIEEVLNILKEE